ncbi:hypothetical protein QLQ97_04135 [Burkholderia pseudomallei]|nr:hypothetical protein [Burkholderia pseudomallei]
MDWQYDLPDASDVEQWCDAATQIDSGYRLLRGDFDSDASLRAYLDRLTPFVPLPRLATPYSMEEDFLEEGGREAFVELIDSYPLDPELLKDNDRVYRRSMVRLCGELLTAKAALEAGQTEKAGWHLSSARFHEGWAQGYYLAAKPAEDTKQSGKKGGVTKEANKRQAVRKACIKHLKDDRPEDGWTSPDSAIRTVAPEVAEAIRKKHGDVDVHALLYDWLRDDPEVRQAGGFTMREPIRMFVCEA